MRLFKAVSYLLLTLLLFSSVTVLNAKEKTTGNISGVLTEKETGQPVIGASVSIVGTKRGAITDNNGRYTIKDVEPGTYTLKITHLDYNSLEVVAIVVKAGLTCDINQQLVRKVMDIGTEITVTGTPKIIDKFKISNEVTISRDALSTKPKSETDRLLENVSGVVTQSSGEVHIRGGRAGEVGYIVDGTPNDKLLKKERRSLNMTTCPPQFPPAHGGSAIVNGELFDAMFFKNHGVNPFVDTEDDNYSTFAVDVDDASFILARSYLDRGALPPVDAIRTEEFINHFNYHYQPNYNQTFGLYLEGAPSMFGENCQLVKIGIKGMEIDSRYRKDANLVFVVDVSGSMAREDRLELVKKALRLLVDELRDNDRVGIVVYGSSGQVVLEPTSITYKNRIISAIEALHTNGATNAEEGLRLGYDMAERMYQQHKINRVILCSDGVANVGRTGPDDILKMIKRQADKGITLASVGFGMGNYNDFLLEKLGNKGNGFYAYVDNLTEAKRIFVDNLTGSLQVIARDVKIQVEFNPEVVRSYRLLGYENRDVADSLFRDDTVDGGEIGSGHEVTALYEIKLLKNTRSSNLGRVFIRYKDPDETTEVSEIDFPITKEYFSDSFNAASPEFKLAAIAGEYAEILRNSYWARGSKVDELLPMVAELLSDLNQDDVIELIGMLGRTKKFEDQLAQR